MSTAGRSRRRAGRHRAGLGWAAGVTAVLMLLVGCAGGSGSASPGTGAGTGSASHPPSSGPVLDPAALPACPRVRQVAPRADGLPPLRLPCLGTGPAVRLSDLRGTPMVLNVWAAWCQPCAEEVPRFAALHRKVGERVRFFGVHFMAAQRFGLSAAKDFGVFYPSVQDTSGFRTVKALRATAPPQTFLVTADGRVVKRIFGAVSSEAQLAALVKRYLGVSA
jgi:cytochrome c biogenesis protein CcmG/thiol:disulfide interchange protein DsbE